MPVRVEQSRDHAGVRILHQHAFGGDHGLTVAELVDDLRRTDPGALSLVVDSLVVDSLVVDDDAVVDDHTAEQSGPEEAGEIVGHVMFSRSLLDAPRRLVHVQVLSPLGVAPHRQRRGIGSALIRRGLRQLDDRGVPLVFLEGDPGYYRRAGFEPAVQAGFRKPSLRIPDPAFQVVRLTAYESWMTGTLVYSSTFWDHDCVGLRAPEAEDRQL